VGESEKPSRDPDLACEELPRGLDRPHKTLT